MNKSRLLGAICAYIVLITVPITSAFGSPMFMGLGDLDGGIFSSGATGISGDGSTIVGTSPSSPSGSEEAFIWTLDDGMEPLGKDSRSRAHSISSDGSTIVGFNQTGLVQNAVIWTRTGEITTLDPLPGDVGSTANGVSADGSVVVGFSFDDVAGGDDDAFRWTEAEGMIGLGHLSGGDDVSNANAVSADGLTIVGLSDSESGFRAFRWTENEDMLGLGFPSNVSDSRAFDVSADGSVIVGRFTDNSGTDAFKWTEAGGINDLGEGDAKTVSSDGSLVGGFARLAEGEAMEAALWNLDGYILSITDTLINDLNLSLELDGWLLKSVWGISDDLMTLTGNGTNPDGYAEAWVARSDVPFSDFDFIPPGRQVPEPATLALFGLGLAGLGFARRKKSV